VNEAQALLDRSLELNANSALAWSARGWVSWYAGKHGESITSFQRAMRLSPFDPYAYSFCGGIAVPYLFLGEYEQANLWADRSLAFEPNFTTSLVTKVIAAAMSEDQDAQRSTVNRLLAVLPAASVSRIMAFHPSRPQAQRVFIEAALRKAGLPE
jgi:tetratricopeptide (TPR) repeat protein